MQKADPNAKILKSGYLLKKGEVNKSWKRRFVVLCNDNIYYYKTCVSFVVVVLLLFALY